MITNPNDDESSKENREKCEGWNARIHGGKGSV